MYQGKGRECFWTGFPGPARTAKECIMRIKQGRIACDCCGHILEDLTPDSFGIVGVHLAFCPECKACRPGLRMVPGLIAPRAEEAVAS